jgi:hypothetical protein
VTRTRDEVRAKRADPWRRGKVGDDGVERISTHTLFDILRGLTPGGFRDQVRGWARAKTWSIMMVQAAKATPRSHSIRGCA